jgi:hypothetical protein
MPACSSAGRGRNSTRRSTGFSTKRPPNRISDRSAARSLGGLGEHYSDAAGEREPGGPAATTVAGARRTGSFAHKTIINPKDEKRGFDADLLVEVETRFANPKALLNTVKDVLTANQRYADKIEPGHRCVTIQYAGEFHLDVVPCVRHNSQLYIANKDGDAPFAGQEKVGTWEATDPDGLSAWLGARDKHANGFLVPTIRLCKWLRDYKGRPKIKSVSLNACGVVKRFRREFGSVLLGSGC